MTSPLQRNMDRLSRLLNRWQLREQLPQRCAFDQLHMDELTSSQRSWLCRFLAAWEIYTR